MFTPFETWSTWDLEMDSTCSSSVTNKAGITLYVICWCDNIYIFYGNNLNWFIPNFTNHVLDILSLRYVIKLYVLVIKNKSIYQGGGGSEYNKIQ